MTWLKICGGEDLPLEKELEESSSKRLTEYNFGKADLKYIEKLNFVPGIKNQSGIDDGLLEGIRQLCGLCYQQPRPFNIRSHRPIIGPVIVAAKKIIFSVFGSFLKHNLENQQKFNSKLLEVMLKIAEQKRHG